MWNCENGWMLLQKRVWQTHKLFYGLRGLFFGSQHHWVKYILFLEELRNRGPCSCVAKYHFDLLDINKTANYLCTPPGMNKPLNKRFPCEGGVQFFLLLLLITKTYLPIAECREQKRKCDCKQPCDRWALFASNVLRVDWPSTCCVDASVSTWSVCTWKDSHLATKSLSKLPKRNKCNVRLKHWQPGLSCYKEKWPTCSLQSCISDSQHHLYLMKTMTRIAASGYGQGHRMRLIQLHPNQWRLMTHHLQRLLCHVVPKDNEWLRKMDPCQ